VVFFFYLFVLVHLPHTHTHTHTTITTGTQLNEMDEELAQYHQSHLALELMVTELNLKINGMSLEIQNQTSRKKILDSVIDKFKDQLRDLETLIRTKPSSSKTLLLKRIAKLHREHNLERKCDDDDDVIVLKKKITKKMMKKKKKKKNSKEKDLNDDVPHQDNHTRKEQNRQRQYLENAVESLQMKLVKNRERHRSNIRKIVRESTTLTSEVNKLRRELRSLEQKRKTTTNSSGGRRNSRGSGITETEARKEFELQRMKIEQLEAYLTELSTRK
jgi:hypothetical protein